MTVEGFLLSVFLALLIGFVAGWSFAVVIRAAVSVQDKAESKVSKSLMRRKQASIDTVTTDVQGEK